MRATIQARRRVIRPLGSSRTDVRGSGDSEGEYNFQGTLEQQDGYDLIEWVAAQPWCNGNVGMLGMSYFAVTQNLTASTSRHLKAIAPYEAWHDRYRHSVYRAESSMRASSTSGGATSIGRMTSITLRTRNPGASRRWRPGDTGQPTCTSVEIPIRIR
jgi:putative CocE/NonD family hydrolase